MQRFMKRGVNSFLWVLMGLLYFSACKSDDELETLSDEGTNDWIYRVMEAYYLWYEDIPEKANLNFSQSPDKFFESLISEQDGVMFDGKWIPFSTIEQKDNTTKTVTASDSYGFEYAIFQDSKYYYAWVLYVLPGSPAAEAGIKRGDWIIAIGSDIMAQYGVESKIGLITSTIMGSTETTLYTIAIYTGIVGIKKTRFVLVAALIGDLIGMLTSVIIWNFMS